MSHKIDEFVSLRLPRMDAIEVIQRKRFLRCKRKMGSEREGEEKNGRGLALLKTFMAFSVPRERTRWSWW